MRGTRSEATYGGEGVRKSWIQRLNVNGCAMSLGLGPYPIITLTVAHDRALAVTTGDVVPGWTGTRPHVL